MQHGLLRDFLDKVFTNYLNKEYQIVCVSLTRLQQASLIEHTPKAVKNRFAPNSKWHIRPIKLEQHYLVIATLLCLFLHESFSIGLFSLQDPTDALISVLLKERVLIIRQQHKQNQTFAHLFEPVTLNTSELSHTELELAHPRPSDLLQSFKA